VFINPTWERAEHIVQHFKSCRRTTLTSTMAMLVLPRRAKLSELTLHWKFYNVFHAIAQMFTR
jgi:hypothetical protein